MAAEIVGFSHYLRFPFRCARSRVMVIKVISWAGWWEIARVRNVVSPLCAYFRFTFPGADVTL
jgi:hypothetical protein